MSDKNKKQGAFAGSLYDKIVTDEMAKAGGEFLNSLPGKLSDAIKGDKADIQEGVSGFDSTTEPPKKVPGQTKFMPGTYKGPTVSETDLLRGLARRKEEEKIRALQAEFSSQDSPEPEMTDASKQRMEQQQMMEAAKEAAQRKALEKKLRGY